MNGSRAVFNLLRTFKTVYETKSFSQAAQHLFLSQPTISHQIQQLEEYLHLQLFERQGHSTVTPTTHARRLYEHTLRLHEVWLALLADLDQHRHAKVPVRLAVSHTVSKVYLPQFMQILAPQTTDYAWHLSLHNSDEVLALMEQHEIDFGLIEKPLQSEAVSQRLVDEDELVLAGDLTQPLWLVREAGSGVYHYTQQYLKEQHVVLDTMMEVASNDMIIALLEAGVGKSIVSKAALPAGVPYQRLSANFRRSFYLLSSRTPYRPELKHLLELVRNTVSGLKASKDKS